MDTDDLRKKTVAELREEAKKLGDVKGVSTMKKDELVTLLSGGVESVASRAKAAERSMTRGDIKKRIRELKKERAAAAERAAKSKVEEFNTALRHYRRRLRRAARHHKP
jgi:Rho termination factor, N-terminal domain